MSSDQKENPANIPSPAPPDLKDVVPQRIQQNVDSVFDRFDTTKNFDGGLVEDDNGNQYIKANIRYQSGTKEEVLDKVENQVVADAKWYKIMYHECLEPEPCTNGYEVARTGGNVPDYV